MMKKMWVMTAVAAAVMALSGCNDNSSQTATAAQAPAKTDVKAGAQAPAKAEKVIWTNILLTFKAEMQNIYIVGNSSSSPRF